MKILFVAPRFPYPTITGDRLRSYVLLKNAAKEHEVTLVCLSNGAKPEHVAHLRSLCDEVHLMRQNKLVSLFQVAWALVAGSRPLQVAYFYSRDMEKQVRRLVDTGRYDLAHVNFVRCGEYLRQDTRIPRVIDFCDSLALELARRVQYQKSWRRPLYKIEADRLRRYEPQLARDYDRAIAISPIDAGSVGEDGSVDVLVNSVRVPGGEIEPIPKKPLSIIFSGYIGFYSDEIALTWFHRHVFPIVLERIPQAHLYIVGASPSARVRSMASDRVTVTGYVEDLRRHLRQSMVSISPMQVGAGLKNKILEAMASGVPVVATTLANQGVRAEHGKSILVADEPRAFAEAVVQLLSDDALRDRISREGHEFVRTAFSDRVVEEGLLASYQRALTSFSARREREEDPVPPAVDRNG